MREILCDLKRRRGGGPELLGYRADGKRGWVDLRDADAEGVERVAAA